MASEQTLGELVREFLASLVEYLKQHAADAAERIVVEPVRRAARKVVILGLALGMGIMAAVMLTLAFFHLLLELFGEGSKSLAYAVCFAVCILIGGLCAWAVSKNDGAAKAE